MSASVSNYQAPVQFTPGVQTNQNPTQNVQTLEMMAQVLAEIAQLLQSSQQSNPAGGQQPAFGQQPAGGAPAGGAPAGGAPAAGATPGAGGAGQGAGAAPMNAQSAAGALSSYASANNISTMDPNALYKLAYNPPANATPTDSAAAKFMLQNPDIYNQIEQHDVSGSDGITGQGNLQWAAQGGLGAAGGSTGGAGGAPAGGAGGNSGALGALGGLLAKLESSLGMGGANSTATPTAGGFGAGTGGGAAAPVAAAAPQGQAGGAAPMNAQSAAGALSSYASANNISTMDPNALYKLAYNPPANATPTDSAAAKFMLQNPDIYNKIETHDVSGSDGITGQGNLQWAAQGGLGAAGGSTGAAGGAPAAGAGGNSGALGALGGLLAKLEGSLGMGGANSTATPTAGGFGAGTTGGAAAPVAAAPQGQTGGASAMNTQSAAGALSAYASANNISTMDPNELYKLANGGGANETQTDEAAAKYMLQNPDQYKQIETHDVAGADGITGQGNLQWAAQGGMNGGAAATTPPAGGTTGYMMQG